MSKSKLNAGIIVTVFVSTVFVLFLVFSKNLNSEPTTVYTVYLDGKSIGTIESKTSFDEFINEKEEQLKEKYNVKEVYTPKGVEIKKNITYDSSVKTNEEIYNKIISKKKFTIDGYQIKINYDDKEKKSVVLYALTKDIFDKAVENTIKAFVAADEYEKFVNNTQEEVKDSGSLIENIDLLENVTYKNTLISTDNKIFTDVDELSKYLLYGTLDKQDTYVVSDNDTIESIANSHKLNVQEFLIANPDFTSENNLLYENQTVNVGLISPIVSVAVDVHSVGDEERNYDTEIQYDESEYVGYQEVIREGENGLYKVTRKSQYVNGQLISGTVANSTEIKPPVNRIIVKGDKYAPNVADLSYWAWPTDRPYTITSGYEYRWGSFHNAIDIYVGFGSAIYAANNGVVVKVGNGCIRGNTGCNGSRGNYIIINHNAGNYYTQYMHLNNIFVSEGQTVARGQKIATMGNTGFVVPTPAYGSNSYAGTHLDFSLWKGMPYGGGYHMNPYSVY